MKYRLLATKLSLNHVIWPRECEDMPILKQRYHWNSFAGHCMFFLCFLFPISHFFFFFLFCTILYVFFFQFHMFFMCFLFPISHFLYAFFSQFHLCFHTFYFLISYAFLNLCFLIFLICTLSNVMYITCTIHTTTCGMGFSLSQHYEGKRLHG